MSKIKPQIKKNSPSKSNYSNGWRLFGAAGLDWGNSFYLFGRNKKDKKK
ncbi:hypothetical protein KVJ92_06800 [Helicobacter pylori]|nr:hypothetical protein KVJ92_06800 [Helicobacter pylori]